MGHFFDLENPIVSLMGKIGDLVILSVFWILLSLTAVLAGPASTALYYASVKCVRRERGMLRQEFFRSVKTNFRQGIIVTLILLAYTAAACLCILFSNYLIPGTAFHTVYGILARALVLPLLLILPWLFPLLARFTTRLGQLFQLAFFLAIRHLPVTLALLALTAASALGIYLLPPLALIAPGLCGLLSSFLTERVFRRYTVLSPDEAETAWYAEP